MTRLLSQDYKGYRLYNTFTKLYGRNTGLAGQCNRKVREMFADSISETELRFYGFVVLKLIDLAE